MRLLLLSLTLVLTNNAFAAEIASVNGKSITTKMYDQLANSRKNKPYAQASQQQRNVLTQILIEREVLYQEAVKRRLNKQTKYQSRLKNIEKAFYSEVLVGELLSKKKFSTSELKEIYAQVSKQTRYEYNLQHILVNDQKKAMQVIKKLQKGASFGKIAEKESSGKFRKKSGKLGWVAPNKLPVPLAQILPTVKKGKINTSPIESQLGWHIVKVIDKRRVKTPPFEKVRHQVENTARKRYIQNYIIKKRKSAKIKVSTN